MLSYALKRVSRSIWLFIALLLGVVLASTFFAGINMGADTTAKAALNQQLDQVAVDLVAYNYMHGIPLSSADWMSASEQMSSVEGVLGSEVITRTFSFSESNETSFLPFRTVGIVEDSRVYDGLTVVSGASSLQANETYVWIDSEDTDKIEIGDVLSFNYTRDFGFLDEPLTLNLTVVGFVSLDEKAFALASGDYSRSMLMYSSGVDYVDSGSGLNFILVDWEKTFASLIDRGQSSSLFYSPFDTSVLGFIDRENVINEWNSDVSQEAISVIVLQVNNKLAEFGLEANSNLEYALMAYTYLSMSMRLTFLVVALPVFFVAWYVGSTVSQVSFNLRRREIGLLSAKGFSSGQLLRLFLSESLVIGIVGGLIGIGISYVLSPYFMPSLGTEFGISPVLSPDLIILVLVFSTGLTLLSTFGASRRSAKLPTLDALREHLYVEETKGYKQKWPLVAFSLGSYKISMTLMGIPSLLQYFGGSVPSSSNIFVAILIGIWMIIDQILTPIAPLLFFWGFTKIFIRGSSGFQKLVNFVLRFLGDIGTLASKNVKRNPVRVASVAFLVALIIGYGFLTVGTLASEEDYVVRQVKSEVGADISLSLDSGYNETEVMNNITSLEGIQSTILEHRFSLQAGNIYVSMVAVEPQEWLSTAYYENEWFSGQSVEEAFQEMESDNNTIILAYNIAKTLSLDVGDSITVTVDDEPQKLTVVGFYGTETIASHLFRSYVPYNFYASTGMSSSDTMLIKLQSNANATQVVDQLLDLDCEGISSVSSVVKYLAQLDTDLTLSGRINVQRIGVIFAVIAASIATALVALVGLQERKKEVAIMNIRGLSFKQVNTMLLAESLSVVIFATVIGCIVGVIMVYGNMVALNAELYTSIVSYRMVFPPDVILILAVSVLLVFLSTVLPVLLITRRYVSRLERIVRS